VAAALPSAAAGGGGGYGGQDYAGFGDEEVGPRSGSEEGAGGAAPEGQQGLAGAGAEAGEGSVAAAAAAGRGAGGPAGGADEEARRLREWAAIRTGDEEEGLGLTPVRRLR
jgi:hypothetical protein